MPLTNNVHNYFERRYGVSLNDAAGNPEVMEKLRVTNGEPPRKIMMCEENYGRGHVFFNQNVSAQEADCETVKMLLRW